MTTTITSFGKVKKVCPECGDCFEGTLQEIAGVRLAVGACSKCFGAPPRATPEAGNTPPEDAFPLDLVDVTKPCAECGTLYTTQAVVMGGTLRDFGRICEACTNAAASAATSAKHEAFVAARRSEWEHICPEYYRTKSIREALPEEKRQAVRKAMAEHGAVLVHGRSGAFKTTGVFNGAVKGLIWDSKRVKFISAMEWKPRCSAAARECRTESFLAPFVKAPHLFVDDLGNMGGTPASIDALHYLTEKRMRARLPMMVTTQFTGDELVDKLAGKEGDSVKAAVAIVRRLALLTRTSICFT